MVTFYLVDDEQGEVQYFIGVQLDGSEHVEPLRNSIPESTAKESEKLVSDPFICFIYMYISDIFVTVTLVEFLHYTFGFMCTECT